RRRFYRAFTLGDKRAAKAVAWIKELYAVEERAKDMSPDERLSLRKKHSFPVLDALKAWMDDLAPNLRKTGKLTEAVRYALQQWVYVRRCFDDGRLEIDNGACERDIREPAIGRKNFLFTGSADAAKRLAAAYSIVQSCRALDISTREYLVDVVTKLENGWPARRLTELLPQNWATARG
ncbi:MAG: transposase, partial [Nannocystaceae bacterium]